MKSKIFMATGVLLLTMGLFGGIAGAQGDPNAPEIQGGLLYDNWWKHAEVAEPSGDHPLWATQSTNTRSGLDTWRCKECHGWDYLGKDGAYGSGSHLTGFPGLYDSRTKSVDELVAALKGGMNPNHDFSSYLDDAMLTNLAVFIQGLRDYRQYVDYSAAAPIGGDMANGKLLFEAEGGCQKCHGLDGTEINFGNAEEPEFVGTVAFDNPQEFMHKTLYGQPASRPRMNAAIERGWTIDQVLDVLAYARTLPTGMEAEPAAPASQPPAALPTSGGVLVDVSLFLIAGGALSLGAGLLARKKR
jgi:thiosulfate dehydrogenase